MQTQPPTNNPLTTTQPPDNNHPPTPPSSSPPLAPNSSPSPLPGRLPKAAQRWSRRGRWLIGVVLLLTVGGTALAGWYFYARKHAARPDLIYHTIKKEKFQITITDRGSLVPADNKYIPCTVKAKTPGQASTSILWVIDNGSYVKEGEKILELDAAALQDQYSTQQIACYAAEQAFQQAELTRTINLLTNEAAVLTQKTNREVALITLREYREGLYKQTRVDLESKRDMSKSDLFMWKERSKWSDLMSQPGRQYVTVSQAEADESRRKTAELTVLNFETQLRVLNELTLEKNRVQFQGNADEAGRQMNLNEQKKEKQLLLDDVAVRSTRLQYQTQMAKLEDLKKDIDSCVIRAPRDGMVVYYVEERARFNTQQAVIAQGELVKEGQKLVAVPDLSKMVVDARIHEAMVARVRDDKEGSTGASTAVSAALLFMPRPFAGVPAYLGFDDPQIRKMFADANPDLENKLLRHGMDAVVRVNAFPDRELKAHVKWVSPVASQVDLFGSDVKVYQTFVAIDDSRVEGFKPGMDANVTIYVDTTPEPVLTIPLQALMGQVEMGNKRRCFVMVDGHPEMREITLAKGKMNEKVAQVEEGLQEGDVVVLNPALLLSEKERAEYGVQSGPSSQSSQGSQGGKDGKKGKKGKEKGVPDSGQGGMRSGSSSRSRSQGGAPSGRKAAASP